MNKTDYNPEEDQPFLELQQCVLCLKKKWITKGHRVCSECNAKRGVN